MLYLLVNATNCSNQPWVPAAFQAGHVGPISSPPPSRPLH